MISDTDLTFGKEDYVPGYYTITIPANSASGEYCTDIQDFIVDDYVLEGVEHFNVNLYEVAPCGALGPPLVTVVYIEDNDGKCTQN